MQVRRHPPNPAIQIQNLKFQVSSPDTEPLNILEEIVWHKEREVAKMRQLVPLATLQQQLIQAGPTRNFLATLRSNSSPPSVIAEVKKASPSKGVFREDFDPVAIAQTYAQHGATCISVLTDQRFFQGSFDNLSEIRQAVDLPLLCKDFILYPYQIYLARLRGADAILLIAAVLSDRDLQYFLKIARILDMVALVEVHSASELERLLPLQGIELLGINNRDLTTFTTSLKTTCDLLNRYGEELQQRDILVVSESGIGQTADLRKVATAGAKAVLVGESLIRQSDPGIALIELMGVSH
jgi:indole-3-glycerol phosphate synthase